MKWKKKHCAHEPNHSQAVYYGQRFLFIALSSLFVCYVELGCGCVVVVCVCFSIIFVLSFAWFVLKAMSGHFSLYVRRRMI